MRKREGAKSRGMIRAMLIMKVFNLDLNITYKRTSKQNVTKYSDPEL